MRYYILMAMMLLLGAGSAKASAYDDTSVAGLFPVSNQGREVWNFNPNWRFHLGDVLGAERADYDDTSWGVVSTPHSVKLEPAEASGCRNYQGIAWYRKTFIVPGNRSEIYFEAIMGKQKIYVNGKLAKEHFGGYLPVIVNLKEQGLKKGDKCVVAVMADNSNDKSYPPGKPQYTLDFAYHGGIYRDVWLINKKEVSITNVIEADRRDAGIFVHFSDISEKQAKVFVDVDLQNVGGKARKVKVEQSLLDASGKVLKTISQNVLLAAGDAHQTVRQMFSVRNPHLWSPETPYLYSVVTRIRDGKQVLDGGKTKLGIRSFEFRGKEGFWLNGKKYRQFIGANRHQDFAYVGNALPNSQQWRDVLRLKNAGFNIIRTAHYPQDPSFMDACDELGLLAWEEIPIIDLVPDTPHYADNCERNLREMIRQHYNHPSIINWGYMNEILLCTPWPGTKEWPAFKERTLALAHRLEKVLKDEDPTRKSVMAFNMTNTYNEIGLNLVDVVGWNLYHGWYQGELNGFNHWCEDQHQRYPKKPMIISEWGAGSDQRLHSNSAHAFDFSIEYQQTYIEHYLPFIEEKPWISGCTYWNFIDFNVAERQESMPRVNNKGIAYNDRTLKDVAYYFKSMWRKDIPVVHIASRDWSIRTGHINEPQRIKVYSNMPEVELIVNGRSYGKKSVQNCFAVFDVVLPFGSSTLEAKGFNEVLTDYKNKVDGNTGDVMKIQYNPLPNLAKGEELAINVGSNCYFISSLSQLTWLPDQAYKPGAWGYVGAESKSTTSEIENTIDGPIYQTWREGDLEYRIDAPCGEYEVELLMADVTKSAVQLPNLLAKSNTESSSKDVRFDVSINDERKESDFTPTDGRHYRTAFKRKYIVENNRGSINIQLKSLQGKAFLNGIKIRKLN